MKKELVAVLGETAAKTVYGEEQKPRMLLGAIDVMFLEDRLVP